MKLPPGFSNSSLGQVCCLKKSLYSLKQDPTIGLQNYSNLCSEVAYGSVALTTLFLLIRLWVFFFVFLFMLTISSSPVLTLLLFIILNGT